MIHSLKRSAIALVMLIVTSVPALAHDLFGETGERWGTGSSLERKGDFDSAMVQYKRALQAIQNIDDQHLRACATAGTIARFEGAKAGKQYLQAAGNDSNSLNAALEASQSRFREVWNAIETKYPNLSTSCP